MNMDVEFKIIQQAPLDELTALYKGAGWWEEYPTDTESFLNNLVKKSYCFVGAFVEGKLIGMGRSLSDGISDAYIQDVTVLSPYRNKGIGGKIIKKLIEYLLDNDIKWIGLVGEPGTVSFYKRLGFHELKGYIPMLYKKNARSG